jgi:hypothetical protein
MKNPEAKIIKTDIDSLSLRDITLVFDIEISNPYPVELKLDGILFDVKVENKQLLKTENCKGLKIKKKGKEVTKLNLNLVYADIMKIVSDYTKKASLDCQIDTKIIIPLPNLPGLDKNATFEYKLTKKIPTIKPSIKVANFKVKMPTEAEVAAALKKAGQNAVSSVKVTDMFKDLLSGKTPSTPVIDPDSLDLKLGVGFDVEMKNETPAELKFVHLDYDFIVNNENFIAGRTSDIKNKDNVSILTVANEFSTKSMNQSVLKIFKSGSGQFGLVGKSLVKVPSDIKDSPLELKFDEKGGFTLP